jgi:hypothetical protein
VKGTLQRAAVLAVGLAALLWVLDHFGVGLPLLLWFLTLMGAIAWLMPRLGVSLLDRLVLAVRTLFWAKQQGRHHSFSGVPLDITDDGQHVWVAADGLMRAMSKREPQDVLAARLAGHWQRTPNGNLQLRVDAVVQLLATMPGRDAHRTQRLRKYLERDVLFPAARRRDGA